MQEWDRAEVMVVREQRDAMRWREIPRRRYLILIQCTHVLKLKAGLGITLLAKPPLRYPLQTRLHRRAQAQCPSVLLILMILSI